MLFLHNTRLQSTNHVKLPVSVCSHCHQIPLAAGSHLHSTLFGCVMNGLHVGLLSYVHCYSKLLEQKQSSVFMPVP